MSDHKHYEHDHDFERATTKVSVIFSRPVEEALVGWLNSMAQRPGSAQLDRIEKEIHHMRAELQQYFTDTKTAYETFGTALDNIQSDLTTLNAKIAALEAAQANAGELTADEITAMNDLKASASGLVSRVQTIADETPDAPTPPSA